MIMNGNITNLAESTSLKIFLCWWLGIKLTIFFKKSFSFEKHVSVRWDVIPSIFLLLFYYNSNYYNHRSFFSSKYNIDDEQEEDSTRMLHEDWEFINNILHQHHFAAPISIRIFPIIQKQQQPTLVLLLLLFSVLIIRDLLITTKKRVNSNIETVKSILLGCSLYLAFVEEASSVLVLSWLSITILATTQLLRYPTYLKIQLRTIRTIFGPCYAICVTGAWWRQYHLNNVMEEEDAFRATGSSDTATNNENNTQFFLFCAALSSCLASFLFRPDNGQLCQLIFSPINRIMMMKKKNGSEKQVDDHGDNKINGFFRQSCIKIMMLSDNSNKSVVIKKYIHAALMIISLFCISYSLFVFQNCLMIIFKGIAIITLLVNAVCTVLGTDSFQKLSCRIKRTVLSSS